jgi:penicillin-binding protein 2
MYQPVDADKFELTRRLSPLFICFFCFLVLVFGRIFYFQIFRGQSYQKLSEMNRIKHDIIPASRGVIKDASGRLLAADEPVPHLLKKERINQFSDYQIQRLALGLGIEKKKLQNRLDNSRRRYIMRGLKDEQKIWFEENSTEFPGLELRVLPKRVYRYSRQMAPVIGYTGEIDPAELRRRRREGLSQGDIIGKAGIEKQYDRHLQGRDGLRWIEVSANGEFIRELSEPGPILPRQGQNKVLNVDARLQSEIAATFDADSEGGVVVMEIPSGKIRALYSHPSYDPAELVLAEGDKVKRLLASKRNPLYNRAIQGRFPPGSTFKLIPFLAALEKRGFSKNKKYYCSGEFRLGDHTFRCWKEEGHGRLNLINALVHSCNVYFYKLVRELGYQPILKLGKRLEYNEKTGVDLPGEKSSQLSSPALKKEKYRGVWTGGDEVNAVIGQGYTLVTPIKQAQILGSILTGKIIKPRISMDAPGSDDEESFDISTEDRNTFIETLNSITERGTGYWAQHNKYYQRIKPDIIGKTGTVQKIKRDDQEDTPAPDAWFVSAAPRDNPRYVVVVFLIEAGMGGGVAAPHARKIYQIMVKLGYFNNKSDRTDNMPLRAIREGDF